LGRKCGIRPCYFPSYGHNRQCVNEKCNNCNPPVVSFTRKKTESNKLQYENQSIAQCWFHPGGNHDRRRHYWSFGLRFAIPNFVKARTTSQQNACINNLRQLTARFSNGRWKTRSNRATITGLTRPQALHQAGYRRESSGVPRCADRMPRGWQSPIRRRAP